MSEAEFAALPPPREPRPSPLVAAIRQARIEAADRTGVVVDLRDAELARLAILNEALDPVFAGVPPEVDLFDRGIAPGEPPRLWIDMVAHVVMGRDKRVYRFVQDTRYGRRILAESPQVDPIVESVTRYVARRLVERERALASDEGAAVSAAPRETAAAPRPRPWKGFALFVAGMLAGAAALLAAAWVLEPMVY